MKVIAFIAANVQFSSLMIFCELLFSSLLGWGQVGETVDISKENCLNCKIERCQTYIHWHGKSTFWTRRIHSRAGTFNESGAVFLCTFSVESWAEHHHVKKNETLHAKRFLERKVQQNRILWTKQNKNPRNKKWMLSQSHIAFRSFTFFLLPQKASSALFLISQFLESQHFCFHLDQKRSVFPRRSLPVSPR